MEKQRNTVTDEEKAAIEAQIADVDRELAKLRNSSRADTGNKAVCDNGVARTLNTITDFDMISAKDLQQLEIEPLEFIVENFLPLGLTVIGAPPKSFKSYMCLDMSLSICTGSEFLGFKTKKHGVLYLDLESTYRRPKNRIDQILQGKEAPDNLHIATQAQLLNGGFPEQLERAIEEHPDIKVVIVDVFKKIRPAASAKNVDGYERDYQDYGLIKELADKLNIAIVLVTHTTKMKHPDDPFNELTGSSGVMGSIDVAVVIKKEKREDVTAKLYITGRDLEEQCYEMQFSKTKYKWNMQGTHRDMEQMRKELAYRQSPIIETIKKLMKQNRGQWRGTASDIITASQYFQGLQIHDSKQQVGQKINEFSTLLLSDCIEFQAKRTSKTVEYEFTYNNPFESA